MSENNDKNVEAGLPGLAKPPTTHNSFVIKQPKEPSGVQMRHPSLHPRLQNVVPHIHDHQIPAGIPRRQMELANLPGEHGERAQRLMGNNPQPPHVIDHVTNILNDNLKHASQEVLADGNPTILHPDVKTIIDKPHKGHVKHPETDGRLRENRKKKKLKRNFEVEQYLKNKKEQEYINQQRKLQRYHLSSLLNNKNYSDFVKEIIGSDEFVEELSVRKLYASLKEKVSEAKTIHAKNELHEIISVVASCLINLNNNVN